MSAVFESASATSKIPPAKRSLDEINQITRTPFPGSAKAYLQGSRPDILVPVRDIVLTNGKTASVYDTSGPYTDPAAAINVRQGLPALREKWIAERGDTEIYTGRSAALLDDGGKNEDTEAARIAQLRAEAAALQRQPRRAKSGKNVTQMHYARQGIITPEMEYIALRENGRLEWTREHLAQDKREARRRGNGLGTQLPVPFAGALHHSVALHSASLLQPSVQAPLGRSQMLPAWPTQSASLVHLPHWPSEGPARKQ